MIYNFNDIMNNNSNYKEVYRIHGIYTCYYSDQYDGSSYSNSLTLPIVLLQSLIEINTFILHIEFQFDPQKSYTNNGPRNTILQAHGQILRTDIDYEMFESLVDDILSYDLIYKNVLIIRHKGVQLLYHAFRSRPNFEEKFPVDKIRDPTKHLIGSFR